MSRPNVKSDECWSFYISDFELHLDMIYFIICVISYSLLGQLGDGETRNIKCSEIHSGRFVSIYLDHDGILTLCEVQVFRCK